MKIYFAADHAGFQMKNELLEFVRDELGYEVEDCGATEFDPSDDYPTIIAGGVRRLQDDIIRGEDSRAIILGASGQGEAIVANRFNGIRAVVYYDVAGSQIDAEGTTLDMIASTREHNDANVLSLGARFLSMQKAKEAVQTWLALPFSQEERHVRRIAKIETETHG